MPARPPSARLLQVEAALSAAGLKPTARAQDLTADQFTQLAWKLQEQLMQGELGKGEQLMQGKGEAAVAP